MTGRNHGRALAVNVAVRFTDGTTELFLAGQVPPEEVAETLGEHCFPEGVSVLTAKGERSYDQMRELAGPTPRASNPSTPAVGEPVPDPVESFTPPPAPETPEPTPTEGEPPRSGQGASRKAWQEFAADLGQHVESDLNRDRIIAQLIDAGLIEP